MALIKCKECGGDVSTEAASCPHCGYQLKEIIIKEKKKGLGCGSWILIIVIGFIFLTYYVGEQSVNRLNNAKTGSSQDETRSSGATQKKIYSMGDTVHVGYMSYSVWEAKWSNRLSSNQYLDERPNAMYLMVNVTARNDDKKARTVPPFKLADENGAEYEESSNAWRVEGNFGMIESLNPDVSKQGILLFDVPQAHIYYLKVDGGYWSSEHALIKLEPN